MLYLQLIVVINTENMKKIFVTLSMLCLAFFAGAADYNPTSTWPYLYEDFQEGTIYMIQGTKMIQKVNVHCAHGKLHFLDKEIIKEVIPTDVLMVEIGSDKYFAQYGVMYKIVAQNDNGMVLASILGDFAALNETGGAYGTSSTSSATTKLSSFELEGQVNQNHMLILQSKDNGAELNLKTTYYVKTPKFFAKASAKELGSVLDAGKSAQWKAWQKEHKIKWNKPESVLEVVNFLVSE